MKSRKWTKILAVMLCLIMLVSVLVACDKPIIPEPEVEEKSKEELFNEVMSNLTDSFFVEDSKKFNADIHATFELDKVGANGKENLWAYEFIAKANVDLTENAKEDDTSLRIELNKYTYDSTGKKISTTLFGILYESEADAEGAITGNYFYISIGGATAIKINGFALSKLVNLIAPGAISEVADLDIAAILPGIISMFLDDECKVEDNVYTFSINLQHVWKTISDLLKPLLTDYNSLNDMLGFDVAPILLQIDGVVAELFGNLTYDIKDDPNTEVDESLTPCKVKDIESLINYLDQNMPYVVADIIFSFDADFIFENLSIKGKYNERSDDGIYTNPSHEFKFNASKVYLGDMYEVQVDEGYSLTKEQRLAMKAINPLKFSANGTVNLGSTTQLSFKIDSDLNPFVLINGTNIEDIKKMGYFSLVVDRINTVSGLGNAGENVLTIFSDFSSGRISLFFLTPDKAKLHALLNRQIALGGTYEFEALSEVISKLMPAPATQQVANAENKVAEDPIVTLIKTLLSSVSLSAEDGFRLTNIDDLVNQLVDIINVTIDGVDLKSVLRTALFTSSGDMVVKMGEGGFKYGECNYISESDLNPIIYAKNPTKNFLTANGVDSPSNGISSNDVMGAFKTDYEYGEKLNFTSAKETGALTNSTFFMKSKDYAGFDSTFSCVYMGSNFDPYKIGSQDVSIYYGINSTLAATLNLVNLVGVEIDSLIPLFGCQKLVLTVNVNAPIITETTTLVVKGITKMALGDDIAATLNALLKYKDENGVVRTVVVTNDMISCVKPVIEKGKFTEIGKFNVRISYFNAIIEQEINVGGLLFNKDLNATTSYDLQVNTGEDIISKIESSVRYYDDKNNLIIDKESILIESIKFGSTVITSNNMDAYFVKNNSGEYRTINDNSYYDKIIEFTYEYELFGETKTQIIKVKNIFPNGYITKGETIYYTNTDFSIKPIAHFEKVNAFGEKEIYHIIFDKSTNKWIAKIADKLVNGRIIVGEALKDTFTVEFKNNAGQVITKEEALEVGTNYVAKITGPTGYFVKSSYNIKMPLEGKKDVTLSTRSGLSTLIAVSLDGTGYALGETYVEKNTKGQFNYQFNVEKNCWELLNYYNSTYNKFDDKQVLIEIKLEEKVGDEWVKTTEYSNASGHLYNTKLYRAEVTIKFLDEKGNPIPEMTYTATGNNKL